MRKIIFSLILVCIWFFDNTWLIDWVISFTLGLITLLLAKEFVFVKSKQTILQIFLIGLVITLTALIITDIKFTYEKCKTELNSSQEYKKCDFSNSNIYIPKNINSFLFKEKGVGSSCKIFIQVYKDERKVRMKNILYGTRLYSCSE